MPLIEAIWQRMNIGQAGVMAFRIAGSFVRRIGELQLGSWLATMRDKRVARRRRYSHTDGWRMHERPIG